MAKHAKNSISMISGRHYQYSAIVIMLVFVLNSSLFAASADANFSFLQPQALNFVGIYALRAIEPNLIGEGVKFGIVSRSYTYDGAEPLNDYTVSVKHPCFAGKEISLYDDGQMPAGISPHATAVLSVLLGEDANGFAAEIGPFYYEGVAPKATADIYEFRHFVRDVVFTGKIANVNVLSMSLGSQFEDWWTRGINRLAEANSITIVAGVGNGTNVNDPLLYPAAGPNVLAVGVVDSIDDPNNLVKLANFSLPSPKHSSVGPTHDGRCKPDIVAPANCLAATTDVNTPYGPTGNWSSFSTPLAAGTIGLLVQKAKSDPNLQAAAGAGSNCVMRAIVMNSAQKLPLWHKGNLTADDDHTVPLDYLQGAGMLDAAAAYRQLVGGQWDVNTVTPDAYRAYNFKADASAGRFITATLVWNRHYQRGYPFEPLPQKDSTLELELWAVDVNNPQNTHLVDYSKSLVDNIQHIYYPAEPNQTDYMIVVSFDHAPSDANAVERYGVAWGVK
jgi:hypothetical protein